MGKQAQQPQKQGKLAAAAPAAAKPQPVAAQKPQQQQKQAAASQAKSQSKPQLPSSDEDEDNEHDSAAEDGAEDDDDDEMADDGSYDSAEEEEGLEDLGEFLGFWSNKVGPGEEGTIDVCAGHMRVLKITTAALGLDAPKGARASLVVRVPRQEPQQEEEDEEEPEDEDEPIFDEFVICTLSEARPDVQLELFYTGTEYVQLKVVGNATIDVTGAVTYMDTGVGGEDEYDEGDDEHAGAEDEDEEEEGLYNEDGEVVEGAHAFDDEDDSEAEADAHGAASVHRRDAARAQLNGKRSAAKKALPSIIQELLGGAGASDEEDQDDANESFRPDADDEDDEDEDDEDDESEDDASEVSDLLSPENAERQRQKLKGKIEVVNSPVQKPAQAPKSPQQKPAAAPAAAAAAATPSHKRKQNDDAAAAPAGAAAAAQTPAKKAKTDGAKTPAPAGAATPAGAFSCAHCSKSFAQEAGLKQHTVTKHAAATPKKA